jgi:hypothetical protein
VTAAEHSRNARVPWASSPRSRLARVALDAATALPEIAGGVRGAQRIWATADAGGILEGVVAAARPDARFDVELHLVAQWPFESLFVLADHVRRQVQRATARADLDGMLGPVTVAFEDVLVAGPLRDRQHGPSQDRGAPPQALLSLPLGALDIFSAALDVGADVANLLLQVDVAAVDPDPPRIPDLRPRCPGWSRSRTAGHDATSEDVAG